MLTQISVLCLASVMAVGSTAGVAAQTPATPGHAPVAAHLALVRGGGGGGHGGGGGGAHMGGGGGGPHMGSGGSGSIIGGNHSSGGGARFAGGPHRGGPIHGGNHHGYWRGGLFIWGYDPGWTDCYYSYRYDGWVCADE